jgi:transposase
VLKSPGYHFKRIGLEAGPLSQWLYSALAEAELPVVCVETRHILASAAYVAIDPHATLAADWGTVLPAPHSRASI